MEDLIKKQMRVADANGWYLAENAYREWIEDFIDEDTGGVVQIKRNEILAPVGELLNPITISLLESNGVEEVFASNKKITGHQTKRMSLWMVDVASPRFGNPDKDETTHYVIPKGSPLECEDFFRDWAQTNVMGVYSIKKVSQLDIAYVIMPFEDDIGQAGKKCIDLYSYIAKIKDDDGGGFQLIVIGDNLHTAECAISEQFNLMYSKSKRLTSIREIDITHLFEDGIKVDRYFLSLYNLHISAVDVIEKSLSKVLGEENSVEIVSD